MYLLSLSIFFLPVQSRQYLINRYLLALKQVSLVVVILVFLSVSCLIYFIISFSWEQTQQFSIKKLLWQLPNKLFCFVSWSDELGREGFWWKKTSYFSSLVSTYLKVCQVNSSLFFSSGTERSKNRRILINKMSPLLSPPNPQLILFSHNITFVGVIVNYCFISFLVI